jgi:gliding motility-associated-like protein
VQVFNPKTVNVIVGWNTLVLDNAFEWDGLSNIIVEVCSSEGPGAFGYSNYTYSCESPYTTTPFISCLYSTTDQFDMCPDLTNFIQSTSNRPNVTFHYCSLVPNPANYSFVWTPATTVANPNAQNTTATPTATTDYIVTVTDNTGGCSDVDTVHVDVINLSSLTVNPAGPYCINGPMDTLTSSVPVGTGVWSGPGISNTTLGVFNPLLAGFGTHQIIYTVSGGCGNAADTIYISVTNTMNATITQVGNQCTSASPITLTAASPGGVWTGPGITNSNTGTFDPAIAPVGYDTITYTITTPCYAQDTMVIHVTSQLDATITPAGPFCTAAAPVVLQAVDPGGNWSGPGITNSFIGIFDPATAGPGSHTITYTISGLCGVSDNETINVIPSPTLTVTSDTTEGCEPTTINFSSTTDQPGGYSYWSFGDVDSGIRDTSTLANPSHTYAESGTYNVNYIYTNTFGCSDSVSLPGYVIIHSQPQAAFTVSPQPTSIVSPEIQFLDYSTGQINTWHWTFGVLNDSSLLQNPVYTYPDTGSYPVQLIVQNIYGCVDTADSYAVIDPILVFYAPNAFTPNENGNNDVFRVYGDGIEKSTFDMKIFNRWGEMIFHTNKYEEGWNGARNNGTELEAQDVYVYKISFKDFAGKKHAYIGHVTMVK